MKKYYTVGYILFIILSSSKCKEEASPLPNPNPWGYHTPALDTLWTAPLGFGITPKFTSNKDVLMSEVFTNAQGEKFKLFDGNTGKLKWEWADYLKVEESFSGGSHTVVNDALILCGRNATYALNMLTGQTLWKHLMDSMSGSPQIYKDEDGYIYHGFDGKNGSYIFRTKYNEPKWELVCSYNDTFIFDKYDITPLAFSQNNKAEKIMIFTLYLEYNANGKRMTKSRVCGYNLNSKQYEWKKDYTDKYYEFRVCKMASNAGKVFTFSVYQDKWYLTAINANDGSIAWDKTLPNFGVSMHLYKDNIVALSGGSSTVFCLNQNTGAVVWETPFVYKDDASYPNMNFAFDDANVFKNYLFSTQCDNLLVLNLDNGAIVFNKPVSLPQGCLQYGVAINEQKRCFYVQDRNKAICYKLPEEVKY
jgi:outer membrane protein assembly factor BamB